MPRRLRLVALGLMLSGLSFGCSTIAPLWRLGGEDRASGWEYGRKHYAKREYQIPMRDGVRLFTAVYTPKDTSKKYPFLLFRTPYSSGPYGEDKYPRRLRGMRAFAKEGFIFVVQDVRGRFMSEGEFVNMTPHVANKKSDSDVDESSDTYDSIEWLLENIPNHNGKVGMWGVSYPGFYTAAGTIDHHPALVAVSPQAPIADWWYDDFHHHGAFFLPHSFNFMATFGKPRPKLTKEWGERFDHGTPDGYNFFMELGSLANVNEKYFHDENPMWNNGVAHPNYDEFWQKRNILPHLNNVSPAVMTVGGWFDAEDLYGPLNIYRSIEEKNPDVYNILVMGPWAHGGWARSKGDHLGHAQFDSNTAEYYRENMFLPFFLHFLKDRAWDKLPEAYMFETGVNEWRSFDEWPPPGLEHKSLFCHAGGGLAFEQPGESTPTFDEYISDPFKPVPFTEAVSKGMTRNYMTDDQRFAGRRPDVLVYQTDALEEDVTLAGPITADLWVSTSGTDSDWIVKLIDVLPSDTEDYEDIPSGMHMGDYQMMVRSEVIRGRFRNSNEHPEPFSPNQPTHVELELQDVFHTFQKGHRIMVQIQSTWFPLVDRNPQTYVDIYHAKAEDFRKATQRVYRSGERRSQVQVHVLPQRRP
ncbi:MAG: CocE/NonD family hydrolase [Planctomycetes bacterium]|nr:CocE/NonD family hydrolase [Planctomycetota bacterium]